MSVAIVGCGYVGIELGRQLTDAGHSVVGARRSRAGVEAIEAAGFDGIRADATDHASLSHIPDADTIVFAASAGGRDAEAAREVYVEGLRTVIEHFGNRDRSPDRLVYTSSTGVYGDHDGAWVDEETPIDPTTERTRTLAEAEHVARETATQYGIDGTVVRFGGLYGPDRFRLERYLEGPVTEGYLNLVHRDDAAGATRFLLEEDAARGEIVLAVDDDPTDKWAFADWLADQCGEPPPPKRTKSERLDDADLSTDARQRLLASKRCSNGKLRGLGYEFRYPTYREGYREAIETYRRDG